MLLPIHTSIRPSRTPYLNYAIIAINIFLFFLTHSYQQSTYGGGRALALVPWAENFMLNPATPFLWQFVTYAFLHGSLAHIFGNMYFLYLFGNNVNDKLGNINYLCLYLGGAIFSGVGHTIFHINPVLGASGAVAAVTGAYLVLFPQTLITVVYWFIFIGTMELSALYFILAKLIIWDNIFEPRLSPSAVAYDAHLAGYLFGIIAIIVMLLTGLVETSHFDLWSMMKRWNQKRKYRDSAAAGYSPAAAAKSVKSKQVKSPAQIKKEEKVTQLKNDISSLISQRNLPTATQKYLELIDVDETQTPPQQYLLDIANQLASQDQHTESAQAYEKFLTKYPNYGHAEQVQLMLGVLYSRYLNQSELAIKNLEAAAKKLTDPGQLKMCSDELKKLQG
ncbi:MAG: rhomboid family intramembrane serine protease [Planctomycetes bacterium]|nr:rhomboid family intramembrane serine protease [Planctomycetota bacterium]